MSRRIHVVAAVIKDERGRVFLAKRPDDKHQGGLWEFPGGKVEHGESSLQALTRELHEEVGIELKHASPLIKIAHDYPDKSVLLDVWTVDQFEGDAHGKESQETLWVGVDTLSTFQFPAANHPIVTAARLPNRYAISIEPRNDEKFFATLHRIFEQGVTLLQLRFKETFDKVLVGKTLEIASNFKSKVLLNADNEIANCFGCHGRHLTSQQLWRQTSRPVDSNLLLGVSCHSMEEIEKAQSIDADFIVLAPVQHTSSHPDAEPLGWRKFSNLADQSKLPVYALGGVKKSDLTKALNSGAQGIAGISLFQ